MAKQLFQDILIHFSSICSKWWDKIYIAVSGVAAGTISVVIPVDFLIEMVQVSILISNIF